MINAFLNVGASVSGRDFVGRAEYLKSIVDHLRVQAQVSICGLGRVGKTSLARESLSRIDSEASGIRKGQLEVNEYRKEIDLWKEILFVLFDDFDESRYPSSSDDAYRYFKGYLRKAKAGGFKAILLMDEFDSIREYDNSRIIIDRIRTVADNRSVYGLSFIFVSRRSLQRIQDECCGSNLFGICQKYYLRPFHLAEVLELVERYDISLPKEVVDRVFYYTGGFPYLVQHLLKEVVSGMQKGECLTDDTVDEAFVRCRHEFIGLYASFKEFLSYKDEWETFSREFVPPKTERASPEIIQHLSDYGLITDQTRSNCISDFCCELLQNEFHNLPLLEPLQCCEKQLRALVVERLQRQYGCNWPEAASEKDEWYRKTFADINDLRKREQMKFHAETSVFDIMEYSYPGTLKDIVCKEWGLFKDILGPDKADFVKSMDAICSIRTPLAHSRRTELVPQVALNQALVAIQKIDRLINKPSD